MNPNIFTVNSHLKCLKCDIKVHVLNEVEVVSHLVFESPVQSGLLVPSTLDRNRNWSSQFEKVQKT